VVIDGKMVSRICGSGAGDWTLAEVENGDNSRITREGLASKDI